MDRLRLHFPLVLCLLALSTWNLPLRANTGIDSLLQRIDRLSANSDSLSELALSWHRLGLAYDDNSDLPRAIDATREALSIRLELEDTDPDQVLVSATNLGLFHQKLGRYEQAKYYYQLVIDRAPNRKVGQVRYQLGKLYDLLGATVLADQSFAAASQLSPFSTDAYNRFFLFLEWGKLYLRDDPEKAVNAAPLLSNALSLCDSLGADADYYRVYTLNRIGLSQIYQGDLPTAINTLNRARQINQDCCEDEDLAVSLATNLGIAHRRQGAMEQALDFYLQSLSINRLLSEGAPDSYLANDHNNLSTFYLLNDQPDSAFHHATQAIYYILPELGQGSDQLLPTEAHFESLAEPTSFLTFLLDLARAETALATTGNGQAATRAAATYQLCDQLIDYLYQTQTQSGSRLEWRATARKVYHEAVAQALQEDKLDLALHYSEKSRAQLLLDEQMLARAGAALPEVLRNRLQELRTAAAYYADQEIAGEQVLQANQAYEELRDSLLQEFPAFAASQDLFRYEEAPFDLAISHFEEHLVEYFFASDYALAFVYDSGTWRVVDLDKQAVEENVRRYRNELLDYQTAFDPLPAQRLYSLLIEPLELSDTKGIIIVPDGPLLDIPFAAFLTTAPDPTSSYQAWPWMQSEQPLSYAFSLRWLAEQEAVSSRGDFLFYGPMSEVRPDFGVNEAQCLLRTRRFSESLNELMSPEILLSTQADRLAFNQLAPTAKAIHLSTHAFPSTPNQPSAYFLLADEKDNRYFTHELFQHRLLADLVVLAACETSLGVLNRGEGVASLGRSFAYAGANSLVTSLWPVDEAATNSLLLPFYKEIDEDADKALALQVAQRTYLEDQLNNERAHPYFWSGLVYHGKHDTILLGRSNLLNSFWWVLVLPLVLPLLYFISPRLRKNNGEG